MLKHSLTTVITSSAFHSADLVWIFIDQWKVLDGRRAIIIRNVNNPNSFLTFLFSHLSLHLFSLPYLSLGDCGSRISEVVQTSLFQLLPGDPEAVPDHMRDIIPPACSGSTPGLTTSPSNDCHLWVMGGFACLPRRTGPGGGVRVRQYIDQPRSCSTRTGKTALPSRARPWREAPWRVFGGRALTPGTRPGAARKTCMKLLPCGSHHLAGTLWLDALKSRQQAKGT